MILIDTLASAHHAPATRQRPAKQLLVFSRYHVSGSAIIDIPNHDVSHMTGQPGACLGFLVPPVTMVVVILQPVAKLKAIAVVIVPDQRRVCFPLLTGVTARSGVVPGVDDDSVFFKVHHQKGYVLFTFHCWAIRAVKVDFRGTRSNIYVYIYILLL